MIGKYTILVRVAAVFGLILWGYVYGVGVGETRGEVKLQEATIESYQKLTSARAEADKLRSKLAAETSDLQGLVLELEAELFERPRVEVSEVIKYVKVPSNDLCRLDDTGMRMVNEAIRRATGPRDNQTAESGSTGSTAD